MARYTPRKLLRAIREPSRFVDEVRRLRRNYTDIAMYANRWYYREVADLSSSGIHVVDEDWDNLLILDACRFDIFSETADFDADIDKVISRGSESLEFIQENFVGRPLHDTVYVTANPFIYTVSDKSFHAVVNLLETGWDDELGTVRPETVVDGALRALEQYPDKRLIVHFMQPHMPFIGPTGRSLDHAGIEIHLDEDEQSDAPHPWIALRRGYPIDKQKVIPAYRENYDVVMPHAEDLVEELPGKTVVTSDHGNLLGELTFPVPLPTYGHPAGIYKQALLEVPWVEIESEERRTVTADPPIEQDGLENQVLEERLQSLGYM